MNRHDSESGWLHEDVVLYKQVLTYTEVRTGFPSRLIEKDYFCTLLLSYLAANPCGLVFKGGTCLSKVLAGFYRISEDLDFVIPVPLDSSRKTRSRRMDALKASFPKLSSVHPVFEKIEPFVGANNSTQYMGSALFRSPVTEQIDRIAVEVSLREPLQQDPIDGHAKTIMLDPNSDRPIVPEVPFSSISLAEGLAEKFRAALSRRDAAIRDFYDIDYAVRHLGLDMNDSNLWELVKAKLSVPGNPSINLDPERFEELRSQRDTRLKTVLRLDDFQAFDLERAIGLIVAMAEKVS